MHAGARGFSADELAPATSEGELVTDLLQSAAAELGTPAGSSISSSDGSGYGERRGRHHFRARLSVRLIDYECAPHLRPEPSLWSRLQQNLGCMK